MGTSWAPAAAAKDLCIQIGLARRWRLNEIILGVIYVLVSLFWIHFALRK